MTGEHCNTLWIGPSLGRVERACLRSVLRQGHKLALYCYRLPDGVPTGVDVRDAAEILPESSILHYSSGSVALFSNWFRYELQRLDKGTWIDADQYLFAPLPSGSPYLFGWQEPGALNSGVLRIPSGSPMLAELLGIFEERTVPAWLRPGPRLAAWLRLRRTGRTDVTKMPWGSTGPHALTALARKYGLVGHALARDVLYPVHYSKAAWVLDPAQRLDALVGPASVGIHLWNERIKGFKDAPAPQGSFLARLQAEGA